MRKVLKVASNMKPPKNDFKQVIQFGAKSTKLVLCHIAPKRDRTVSYIPQVLIKLTKFHTEVLALWKKSGNAQMRLPRECRLVPS